MRPLQPTLGTLLMFPPCSTTIRSPRIRPRDRSLRPRPRSARTGPAYAIGRFRRLQRGPGNRRRGRRGGRAARRRNARPKGRGRDDQSNHVPVAASVRSKASGRFSSEALILRLTVSPVSSGRRSSAGRAIRAARTRLRQRGRSVADRRSAGLGRARPRRGPRPWPATRHAAVRLRPQRRASSAAVGGLFAPGTDFNSSTTRSKAWTLWARAPDECCDWICFPFDPT